MRRLAAAVAAIALIAGAAQAQGQGQGQGRGGGPSGKPAEAGGQGGGHGKADRGPPGQGAAPAARPAGPSMRGSDQDGGGNEKRAERATNGKPGNARPAPAERRAGNDARDRGRDVARGNAGPDRGNAGPIRGNAGPNRGNAGRDERAVRQDFTTLARRGVIEGCPPGLAKKRNGCQPPGQDRRENRFGWDQPDFWGLALGDGRYFYDDGYLVRYAPSGGLLGYVPLLGGALSIGNAWPANYGPYELPDYYESYYGLGRSDSYRYADDVIYRIDPQTDAITSIAALLTGDQFGIGQPMPAGYDIYNVPYGYRDQYFDRPDAQYRYADGYVYEVDPTTQLISAVIELLVS